MIFKTHILPSKWLKLFAFVGLLAEFPLIIEHANLIVSAEKKIQLSNFNIDRNFDYRDLLTNESINNRNSETIDEENGENANFDDFAVKELATVDSAMTIIQDLLHKLNPSNLCTGFSGNSCTVKNDVTQSFDEFQKEVNVVVKSKDFKVQINKFYNKYVNLLRQRIYWREIEEYLFSVEKNYQDILSSNSRYFYSEMQRCEMLRELPRLSSLINYLLIRQIADDIIWTDNGKTGNIEQRIESLFKKRLIDTKSPDLGNLLLDLTYEQQTLSNEQQSRMASIIKQLKSRFKIKIDGSNQHFEEPESSKVALQRSRSKDGRLSPQKGSDQNLLKQRQDNDSEAEINAFRSPIGLNAVEANHHHNRQGKRIAPMVGDASEFNQRLQQVLSLAYPITSNQKFLENQENINTLTKSTAIDQSPKISSSQRQNVLKRLPIVGDSQVGTATQNVFRKSHELVKSDQSNFSSDESSIPSDMSVVALDRSLSVTSDKLKSPTSHKKGTIHQQERQKAEGRQYNINKRGQQSNSSPIREMRLKYALLKNALEEIFVKPETEYIKFFNQIYLNHFTNYNEQNSKYTRLDNNLLIFFGKSLTSYNRKLIEIETNEPKQYTKSDRLKAANKRKKLRMLRWYFSVRSRIDKLIFNSWSHRQLEKKFQNFVNAIKITTPNLKIRLQLISDLKLSFHRIFGRRHYPDEIIERKDRVIEILK